jgi:hypothetical protein
VKVVGTMLMHSLIYGHDEMNPYYSKAMALFCFTYSKSKALDVNITIMLPILLLVVW